MRKEDLELEEKRIKGLWVWVCIDIYYHNDVKTKDTSMEYFLSILFCFFWFLIMNRHNRLTRNDMKKEYERLMKKTDINQPEVFGFRRTSNEIFRILISEAVRALISSLLRWLQQTFVLQRRSASPLSEKNGSVVCR